MTKAFNLPISKLFQPTAKVRHAGMAAGIQPQGHEVMTETAPCNGYVISISYTPTGHKYGKLEHQ